MQNQCYLSHALLAFTLGVGRVGFGAAAQAPSPSDVPTTTLQYLLADDKNTSIHDISVLGRLDGPGQTRATFVAVVVSNSKDREKQVRALEIKLETEKRKRDIFLDRNLKYFEKCIAYLAEFKEDILETLREDQARSKLLIFMSGKTAYGRLRGEEDDTEWGTALHVSWYRMGTEFGVALGCSNQGCYFFPNADMAQLADIIASGHKFLLNPDESPDTK